MYKFITGLNEADVESACKTWADQGWRVYSLGQKPNSSWWILFQKGIR